MTQQAHTPGPTFTEAEKAQHQRAYEDELLHRYHNHKNISKADRALARRIIRDRAIAGDNLRAAAPDLLARLERRLILRDKTHPDHEAAWEALAESAEGRTSEEMLRLEDEADRAAIAKARGQS